MKKLIFISILITACFLISKHENCFSQVKIIYYNNFEQDSVGNYTDSEKSADWDSFQKNPGEGIYQDILDTQNSSKVYRFFFPRGNCRIG